MQLYFVNAVMQVSVRMSAGTDLVNWFYDDTPKSAEVWYDMKFLTVVAESVVDRFKM